jgi:hypothetical protein
MNGLELGMGETCSDKRRQGVLRIEIGLELAQQLCYPVRRRWNEAGVARTGATDPVLRLPDSTRLSVLSPSTGHEPLVGSVQESNRKRKPFLSAELASGVFQRFQIVADLFHVLRRGSGRCLGFRGQQIV